MAKAKTKPGAAVPSVSRASAAEERRWRAESDLRTMQQYAELKQDPSRIRAAESMLKQQLRTVQSIKR